ncbi:MAG: hypothetical protein K1060chlam2_00461 [Chlamydiae bacterium]|nr:hypothetical protein [Chlamydiota bacterium]
MNELYFFLHILSLITFVLIALRLGKEALITCFAVQIILANLFVTKQMVCFGLHVTCADVYTIGALFSLSLLQEYFGKAVAKRAIWTIFFILLFFIAMSQLHLSYIPSEYDSMHRAFKTILGYAPRIIATSFLVGLLTQKLDVELFGFLKKRLPKSGLLLRFTAASLVTQLLDTLLFSFIALYGIVHSMGDIILMSYLIKVVVISCIAPFTTLAKQLIRHDPIQV